MSNLRRHASAFLLAAVVAFGITLAPAPAQANDFDDFDVCDEIESVIARVEESRFPQRVKDAIIAGLERFAQAYGCEGS